MQRSQLIDKLKFSLEAKDPDDVDIAVTNLFEIENPREITPILCSLLQAEWHFDHEDIARLLQEIGDPMSINALKETAYKKFDYLDYDNSYPLARKCIWALAAIGTKEAKEALEEIIDVTDPIIAGFAKKRIENWENEIKRKKNCI
jgi:HEAT repeat protein